MCGGPVAVGRPDGAGRKSLLTGATHPSWSADGLQLTYASTLSSDPGIGIWIASFDAASATLSANARLTSGSHLRPAWSPDAGWIAYQDSATDGDPDWSQDGQYLVFTRGRAASGAIKWLYLVSAAGGSLIELVYVATDGATTDPHLYLPAWRPTGNEVVYWFCGKVNGVYVNELRLMTVSTSPPGASPSTLLLAGAGQHA